MLLWTMFSTEHQAPRSLEEAATPGTNVSLTDLLLMIDSAEETKGVFMV